MGVCVNGRCSRIGCDGKINSGITVDMCGICGGNNSTCTKVAAVVFTDVPVSDSPVGGVVAPKQPPSQYGYNMVVRVPRHATHIKVVDNSSNYLAILDGKTKKYVFNGDWVIDWPGNYEAGGTDFKYNRQKDQSETVTADGPVEHEVTVMLLQRSKNPGVYYEYWIPKDTKNKKLLKHKPPPPIIFKESTTKRVQAKLKKTTPKTTTTTTTQPPGTTATLIQALPTAASLVRKSGARKMYYTFGNRTYQKFPTLKNRVLMPKKRKSRYGVLTNEINPDRWSATWVLQDKNWEEKLFKKERKTKAKKVKKVKKEEQYCSFSCRRKQSARKNFCKSDFGIKAKVLHYDVIQDEIRYEVEVLQSYKNTVPMLSREYIWAAGAKCFCPRLKIGKEYIMLGSADKTFRKNEARFYLSADSYVRPFNRVNLERILRLRRDEVRYCSKYKH
ncbi:ADAMTS-like protein 5 [Artemia franciscana]|uniref:ADAMTS-like protein 5 n=1 Tax=Artemia franciscana TaxID=6661 RepID=UPI0032D9EEE0